MGPQGPQRDSRDVFQPFGAQGPIRGAWGLPPGALLAFLGRGGYTVKEEQSTRDTETMDTDTPLAPEARWWIYINVYIYIYMYV